MNGKLLLKVASENPENLKKLAYVEGVMSELIDDEEFLQEQKDLITNTEKLAFSFGGVGDVAKKGLGVAGLAGAGVIGTALVNDMYDTAKKALTKKRNYERMLMANPDLEEYPADKVKAYFTSFHEHGGPELSGDPYLAGDFVRQHTEFAGRGMVDSVKKLVDIRAQKNKAQSLSEKVDFSSIFQKHPQEREGQGGGSNASYMNQEQNMATGRR
jgi:hypothetical protein